jgi:hypothetical protein
MKTCNLGGQIHKTNSVRNWRDAASGVKSVSFARHHAETIPPPDGRNLVTRGLVNAQERCPSIPGTDVPGFPVSPLRGWRANGETGKFRVTM